MSRATPASAQMAGGGLKQARSFDVEDSPATKRVRHAYRTDLLETKELLDNQLLTEGDAADDRAHVVVAGEDVHDARIYLALSKGAEH